jgi:hypothetical protein
VSVVEEMVPLLLETTEHLTPEVAEVEADTITAAVHHSAVEQAVRVL